MVLNILDDTNSDDTFIHHLKIAYNSCSKKGNGPVTASALANKYVATHSDGLLKKNLKGKKFTKFLSESSDFTCTGGQVIVVKGMVRKISIDNFNGLFTETNNNYVTTQELFDEDRKNQKSKVQKSANMVTNPKQLKILVHFKYGKHEFPKKIPTDSFRAFYNEVLSTFQKKMPNYKACNIQFLCGHKWYGFSQDVGFDSLCLDDDPELSIRATPIIILGKYYMHVIIQEF